MRASSIVIALGAVLFVAPVPGTFVGGALVGIIGGIARLVGL